MHTSRRTFLATCGALAATARAARTRAQWQESQRYPDPRIQIIDPSFAQYRIASAKVERIASGMRWAEGPVWFGDGRYLLWSDIPNNRIMRWDEETGAVSVFRQPSNYSNGNTRDRQGRLITCEHDARRVTRTEYDGTHHRHRRTLRRQAAELAERRRVQIRRLDLVHRSAVRDPRQLRGPCGEAGAADQRLSARSADRPDDRRGRRHQSAERPLPSRPTRRGST